MLVFTVPSSGDKCFDHSFSECELNWFFTVHSGDIYPVHSFSACELAWFSMFTFLVTHAVACLVSGSDMA